MAVVTTESLRARSQDTFALLIRDAESDSLELTRHIIKKNNDELSVSEIETDSQDHRFFELGVSVGLLYTIYEDGTIYKTTGDICISENSKTILV